MSTTVDTVVRPATADDEAALAQVLCAYEARVFGSAPEPAEAVELVGDLERIRLAQVDGSEPAALVRTVSDEQVDLLAVPGAPRATRELLRWVADTLPDATIRVPENDGQLLDALPAVTGWHQQRTSYEVFRDTSTPLAPINVADRVRIEPLPGSPDLDALHELIYHDAEWAESGAGRYEDRIVWRRYLAGHELRGALATDTETGRPTGVIIAWQDGPELGWIHRLAVAAGHRGQGIADGLMQRTLLDARSIGAQWLGAAVYGDNGPARKLYDRWKFDAQNRYFIWRATA
ncbi:MAG TPA: GNAT family N-acetyltransferase [Pseudonocardiaceae bacterium]|jgi:GNAT superfamily N-acetyltransferase|nr:GNAT family N-acetyltransferase [Pseudonocardiaceae bacterium]